MDFLESFLQYEKENKMYDKKVLGLKYWEYIRYFVYARIQVKVERLSEFFTVPRLTWKNYRFNLKELNKYLGLCKLTKHDLLFISHPRRISQDGKYENIYTDEVEQYLSDKYSCVTLEEPCWNAYVSSEKGHLFPTTTENIIYTDILELSYSLKKRIYKIFNRCKIHLIEKEIVETLSALGDKYNVDIMELKEKAMNSVIYGLVMKKKFLKILKKISPKAMFIHHWPTDFKTLMVGTCNELDIKTIELQHGTVTYDMPIIDKCYNSSVCKHVSKYLFSFGILHTNTSHLAMDDEHLKEVGYPFLERTVNEKRKLPVGYEQNKKYILIVSQPTIGDEMSVFASKLADLLIGDDTYRIIFKYHPNEVGRIYPNLEKANIIKINHKGEEIYKYHKFSYVQVGVSSTAISEGIAFGLPTFVLKGKVGSDEEERLLSFMNRGVYYINNEEELYDMLKNKLDGPLDSDIGKLWKKNSFKNIEKELTIILNK